MIQVQADPAGPIKEPQTKKRARAPKPASGGGVATGSGAGGGRKKASGKASGKGSGKAPAAKKPKTAGKPPSSASAAATGGPDPFPAPPPTAQQSLALAETTAEAPAQPPGLLIPAGCPAPAFGLARLGEAAATRVESALAAPPPVAAPAPAEAPEAAPTGSRPAVVPEQDGDSEVDVPLAARVKQRLAGAPPGSAGFARPPDRHSSASKKRKVADFPCKPSALDLALGASPKPPPGAASRAGAVDGLRGPPSGFQVEPAIENWPANVPGASELDAYQAAEPLSQSETPLGARREQLKLQREGGSGGSGHSSGKATFGSAPTGGLSGPDQRNPGQPLCSDAGADISETVPERSPAEVSGLRVAIGVHASRVQPQPPRAPPPSVPAPAGKIPQPYKNAAPIAVF